MDIICCCISVNIAEHLDFANTNCTLILTLQSFIPLFILSSSLFRFVQDYYSKHKILSPFLFVSFIVSVTFEPKATYVEWYQW